MPTMLAFTPKILASMGTRRTHTIETRRYSRRAREGTRAYAHAYARTYAAHMRCYYGNQNCTVMLSTIATIDSIE